MTLSGCPDLSRSSSPYLTDCAVPSRTILRDQDKLVAPFSKKFYQVALIDRTSQSQLSTLEKTKHRRNPILNDLLKRISQTTLVLYQVALVYLLQQLMSMDLDFRNICPRLDEVKDDTNDGVLAIRFIIGLNLAVTRSSPES